MADGPVKGAPNLGGWVIGAGMGLVAFGAAHVAMDVGATGAAFVGAVIALVVGLILGMPAGGATAAAGTAQPAARPMTPSRMLAEMTPAQHAQVDAAAGAWSDAVAARVAAAAPSAAEAAQAEAPAASSAAPMPAAPAAPPETAGSAARRPEALASARGGKADDLKIIKGIGPKLEALCHRLGFFHFDQIAGWSAEEVAWVDENLEGFKGRVTRDRWVPQAKAIVTMGPEAFLRRLDAGEEF